MQEETYDPVLSCDDVPKWRLVNPLRPPAPGRALVLVRDSGPSLTIRSGEEIPSARFGSYRAVFTVDMTEHRLILDIPLLSRDPTFSFRSRVDLVCRVADPAQAVARGIRDMSGALYGYLRKRLQSVARDYDIAEFHETETALNSGLAGFSGDDAVRLRSIQIELLVDEEEIATSGRAYRDVVRETRLEGMRRRRHLDMIREEGVDGLIAEIMEKEGPRAALAWIEKGEAEKREVRREVMRMVLERGDADREPFEQAKLERAVLEEVLRDGDGLFDTAARRGRLSGSLARALEPGADDRAAGRDEHRGGHGGEREPLKGEVLRDRYDDGDRGAGGARPREESASGSRLSGTGGRRPHRERPAGPPEDEPLPGTGGGRVADDRHAGADRRDERRADRGAPADDHDDRRTERGTAADHRDGPRVGRGAAADHHAERSADRATADRPGVRGTGGGAGGTGGGAGGDRADDGTAERRTDGAAPRVSRVRGTAKRHRPDTSDSNGERR
ncbi:hypothetical protein [Streptomyces alanosinicus]|uniref:Band 7 domain-containing protein n=1 Tax=Streptomyces alanosinicus TaxID=68171 RepID=A0A919D531_9ACTN|nr:hypothetical protein [Streptomyces alanosinicus]GHE09247.1 hypothetical protein GCM10010339_60890 [Streptomyces alanosinicus]